MSEKKSFIIYKEWAEIIKRMPQPDAGELIQAICNFVTGTEYATQNIYVSAIFEGQIKPQLEKDCATYEEVCRKRSEAGKEGMKKRWSNNKTITNDNKVITNDSKPITKITDNDNDNENDNDNNKKSIRARKKKYGEYKNVSLSDKDLETLNAEYGIDETQKAIKRLDEYIETSGKKYKNHVLVMKRWVYKAVKEDAAKDNNPKIHNFESEREYNWDDIEKDFLRR